jgi:uncharacterized protein (DUF1330 family)
VTYYAVAEIDIADPGWVPSYVTDVTRLVERHGGRYLARTGRLEKLEGTRTPPQVLLLVEWPSKAAALSFLESDAYRPYRERRRAGARTELILVAGEDAALAAGRDRGRGAG